MRKVMFIVLVIAALLLAGCGGESAVKKSSKPAKYSGFMDLKAGQWVEMVSKQGGQKMTTRTEVLESSPDTAKFQVTVDFDGQETVSQFWLDRKGDGVTKFVVKSDAGTMCMDTSQMSDDYIPADGGAFPDDNPSITHGTYETPTGKKVTVAKFTVGSGETWVSSDVPFGLVKTLSSGSTRLSLYDFGTIGAKSLIDEDDLEDCTDVSDTISYRASEPEYDEPVYEEDEYDYEAYYEEEAEEENPDYETTVREMGSGEEASIGCDACDGMPQAARNACLAACS